MVTIWWRIEAGGEAMQLCWLVTGWWLWSKHRDGIPSLTRARLGTSGWVVEGATTVWQSLVGGLEHCLFSHILGIIIPIDFHIFQRGSPTTNQLRGKYLTIPHWRIGQIVGTSWDLVPALKVDSIYRNDLIDCLFKMNRNEKNGMLSPMKLTWSW